MTKKKGWDSIVDSVDWQRVVMASELGTADVEQRARRRGVYVLGSADLATEATKFQTLNKNIQRHKTVFMLQVSYLRFRLGLPSPSPLAWLRRSLDPLPLCTSAGARQVVEGHNHLHRR